MLSLKNIIYCLNNLDWSLWALDGRSHCEHSAAWPHKCCRWRTLIFHIPPINPIFTPTYLRPDSSDRRPSLSVCICGGGGGVVTTNPSRTSASAAVFVLSSPTNVAASSDTASCAAPMVLSIRVLHVSIPSVPVPVSYIGSLITAPVKLSLPQRVDVDPANPDVTEYLYPNISPQGRIWVCAIPESIILGVVAQIDLPNIRQQGVAEGLQMCRRCNFPLFIHYPQLRV